MVKKKRGMNKKGLESEMAGYWLLGLAVLVLVIGGIITLILKGTGAINYLKNILGLG